MVPNGGGSHERRSPGLPVTLTASSAQTRVRVATTACLLPHPRASSTCYMAYWQGMSLGLGGSFARGEPIGDPRRMGARLTASTSAGHHPR